MSSSPARCISSAGSEYARGTESANIRQEGAPCVTLFPLNPQTKQRRPPTFLQNGHLEIVNVFSGLSSSLTRAAMPLTTGVVALDERAELDPPVVAPSVTWAKRSISGGF